MLFFHLRLPQPSRFHEVLQHTHVAHLRQECHNSKFGIFELLEKKEMFAHARLTKKKKQLQETVHSTVLLGCFYLLYML